MPRERNRYRDRRSLSNSSESSYDRKKSKSKHKRRSRSTDRSELSNRRKRSSSRSRQSRKSYSRSLSRDRYGLKSKKSPSRSRSKRSRRSESRPSHSRSSSISKSKHKKSHKKSRRRSRSSSSRSSSFDIEPAQLRKVSLDDTNTKIEKAIKAAEAAGLTMTKLPKYEYKDVEVKEDMPTIHDRNLLEELNCDSFTQKSFTSSRSKKHTQNIVIDLDSQTMKVPESDVKDPNEDSIIDFNELPTETEANEMWIKKLYQYRKRMLRGDI